LLRKVRAVDYNSEYFEKFFAWEVEEVEAESEVEEDLVVDQDEMEASEDSHYSLMVSEQSYLYFTLLDPHGCASRSLLRRSSVATSSGRVLIQFCDHRASGAHNFR
jgi:hypothetical protein